MELVQGDIKAQAQQVLRNLLAILEAAGASADTAVVKTTCFLKNMNDFVAFNEVYAEFFKRMPRHVLVLKLLDYQRMY